MAKYLRAADSLMMTTLGAVWMSRSLNVRPLNRRMPITSKKLEEMTRRLMLSLCLMSPE